jgi:uncharacterized protein YfaS (alpha-2-macroglobulin family)
MKILKPMMRAILYSALMLFIFSCNSDRKPVRIEYDQAFDPYLSAFTNGEISQKGTILIRFAEAVTENTNQSVPNGLLQFQPALKGEAVWRDNRTLEFLPSEDLASGQIYTAKLKLNQLFDQLPSKLSNFKFQFKAKDQFVNVSPMASKAINGQEAKWMRLQGKIETYDVEDAKALEDILKVFNGNEQLAVSWTHENGHEHIFTIDSVKRQLNPYALKVTWNGNSISAKEKGSFTFNIPGFNEFKYQQSYRYNQPEQHIILEFSDQLDPYQNLDGLIKLGGNEVKYSIENNLVKIYPEHKLLGDYRLEVEGAIKSTYGKLLEAPSTETITFSDAEPAVEFIGKGNIIPKSTKMPVIFKTINLNAIDIRVIKIKEDNIIQFFQVNQIDGQKELKRVGTEVLRKRIALDETKGLNLAEWTHHSLDLAELIEPEPGAIYEIALGFRPSYSLYQCDAEDQDVNQETDPEMLQLHKNWDNPSWSSSYWDWYGSGYSWQDKDNPCKFSYYHGERVAKKNVLASDLGIIAKQADNGNLFVVSNLQTTAAMAGVSLEFYDYHQDLIKTVKTNKDGMVEVDLEERPFMLIAKSGNQRGYLRLDDGSALSMSRFDVQGTTSVKGLKGFIYGERGVWRPGDELFLNFILEDKEKSLPKGHPVNFELRDPRGAIVLRQTKTEGVNGMYNFTCQTHEDANTGNYQAIVRVGGATFTKSIKIESIKPNRLKMAIDFGVEAIDATKGNLSGQLNAKWLHGAKAKNLKAKIEMSLKEANTSFKQFPDFNFQDPATKIYTERQTIFEGKLDENGDTDFPVKMPKRLYAPGMLSAVFNTQVFEPGGDFSIDQLSVPLHPYQHYVGVRRPAGDGKRNMLLTDQKHKIQVATVDQEGNPVAKSKVEVKLYKLSWRWWFDKNKNEVSSYRGRVNAQEIDKATISTNEKGLGTYEMEVKHPNWGRFLVRACDGDGHCSGQIVYIDWPGWAGKSREGDPEGATALNFTTEKEKYTVGEEIKLNIPTGFAGRALVTIESGSNILSADWVEATKGTTSYSFKATAKMAPNVYAYVTLIQPHAQTKNDLPIRMYGVLPISIEDPNTHLEPTIAMSDELRPMQEFTVTVGEKRGGPMNYTLAIVDDGLLDLTRFKTPSPWSTFYQREALGVKTWDMYNSVLGAFGGSIKSLLSIGGDGALLNNKEKNEDRFKPVVLYAGPFHLDAGKTKTHTFKMPNYVGSVRAMVVAAEDGAYGSSEKTVPVRQPLMVLASIPRVLGPGETMKLPVTVFAMKEGIKEVSVKLKTNEMLEVVGGNSRSISFSEMGEEMTYFMVKVKDKAGWANVQLEVNSAGHQANYNTDVEVRLPNPMVSEAYAGVVEAGKAWEQAYNPVGIAGTNSAVFEVAAVPPINLGKRLNYLIRYPYGCIEQTTSSVFPQLYVSSLMELPKKKQEEIDVNVKAGISRLQSFQLSNGGLGYWQGANSVSEWGTNYAGHFLLEAENAGYKVPKEMMRKWVNYQREQARQWAASDNASNDMIQAYRLYLLALAGKAELGAMNRMRLTQTHKNAVAARWHLAAAYHLAGQKSVAKEIANKAVFEVIAYSKDKGARTFGTALRDQALILQTLSIMDNRANADQLVKSISAQLSSNKWLNTQETAQALVAMAKFTNGAGISKGIEFEYRIAGGKWQKVKSDKPLWQLELAAEGSGKVELRNKMKQTVFARVVAEGVPAAGNEVDASNGMTLKVRYTDLSGKDLDVTALAQGEDFLAEVTITNTGGYTYNEVALAQVFPSGWEVINHRLMGIKLKGNTPEYQDIRDDRVYTFFDLGAGKSQVYQVRLNATYLGKYYLPSVSVEAMYDKSLNALKKGQWVEVIAASGN